MKKLSPKGTAGAFTLIEILVILLTLILIAAIWIPHFIKVRREALAKGCSDNLKQVGLAFRTWGIDSSGDPAMHIPVAYGGTKELVVSGQVFVHFRVMSNELSTPKVLVCPRDKAKIATTNFSGGFSDKNVSYFLGTDALETDPQMFLSGDRNLSFQGQPITPGLFVLTTNTTSLGWAKGLHHPCGNTGLADGSVQFFDSNRLTAAVRNQGIETNRLAIP
jgi:competence protein ComGC